MSFEGVRRAARGRAIASDGLMTRAEIEREFHISGRTIGRLVEDGKLTPVPVRKTFRIARAELLAHLASARRSA
jgi:excisionase family DNA binding protein